MGMGREETVTEPSAPEDYFYELPEGCIAHIVSLTTPRDACRLSLVSTIFRSAADSDAVWDRFLPPDCLSLAPPRPTKKDLYFSLCQHPLLIDQGTKSFSLDKVSGKKCYMLSARSLTIIWSGTPRYWRWVPLPEARFEDVAELVSVCWFEVRGKIDITLLSPSTLYSANLVFKSKMDLYGFQHHPVVATIGLVGGEMSSRQVYLDTERGRRLRHHILPRRLGPNLRYRRYVEDQPRESESGSGSGRNQPKQREDDWCEIELGEFFYDGGVGELEMSAMEVQGGDWKGGIIVQGIEIRPKKV